MCWCEFSDTYFCHHEHNIFDCPICKRTGSETHAVEVENGMIICDRCEMQKQRADDRELKEYLLNKEDL